MPLGNTARLAMSRRQARKASPLLQPLIVRAVLEALGVMSLGSRHSQRITLALAN
jgi:hypothetical protein